MERTMFDYSRLKGRIKEKCDTQKVFAERLGVTEGTLISKLSGATYFTQGEIFRASDILAIERGDLGLYFFSKRVQ